MSGQMYNSPKVEVVYTHHGDQVVDGDGYTGTIIRFELCALIKYDRPTRFDPQTDRWPIDELRPTQLGPKWRGCNTVTLAEATRLYQHALEAARMEDSEDSWAEACKARVQMELVWLGMIKTEET